ncbi:protein kinase domain-containing protein [Thomasclavelia cocleata]|jgi:serine/threonine protein kinase|uniref:protein kinase domain-containing protein n=1 Tax=Thomasclavelia cocleata TaxID=69824 RepID=UPI00241DAE58|nr:protein kinase [Thomasclavelia cocleata]MCI9131192.1 protein kinase [Thomasclavelia cocleata]
MEMDFFDKLFEFYDKYFIDMKIEVDYTGKYGLNYEGLVFDEYLDDSRLFIDYLDIDDFFLREANVPYTDKQSLVEQYSKYDTSKKADIIAAILTLITQSNYKKELSETLYLKSENFLNKVNLELRNDNGYIKIINGKKINEGSYCEIFDYNTLYYKKKLKRTYSTEPQWIKRLKYEFDNMEKLSTSPYILNVLNYNNKENSYLMEKCDCCIYDYINNNPNLTEADLTNLIRQIIYGMKDAHNIGIIHRDLHLGNILIKDRQAILCDFGLSKDTMINHSLLSSVTPKNSHRFMAPEGLIDFTQLDKTSDIYSIGKIIEYLTQNSNLNQTLSYVINKAINRDKKYRYQNLEEMLNDIESALETIEEQDRIKAIENNIKKSQVNPQVISHISFLLESKKLSYYIVENQLYSFWELLIEFPIELQERVLIHINQTYIDATGYGQWHNYDLFAEIVSNYIQKSTEPQLQKIAFSVLKGCATKRFDAKKQLEYIELNFPYLK